MAFVDANVFILAALDVAERHPPAVRRRKEAARAILRRIQAGESAQTSVVHLSEVANVLEATTGDETPSGFLRAVFGMSSLEVLRVDRAAYEAAAIRAEHEHLDVNDALALVLMAQEGVGDIYSFDAGLDGKGATILRA